MLNRMRRRIFAFFAFLAIAVAFSLAARANAAQQAIDVFGRPVPSSPAPASSPSASMSRLSPAMSQPKPSSFLLPAPVRAAIATGIVWQGELNSRISDAAARVRRNATPATWFALLLLSFAYGVLHAVGPGHGKLVTGAYLGSRKTSARHALVLCGWTATVQALSALVLVFGMTWFAKAGMAGVLTQAESIEVVSYALLCIAGGWAFYTCIARRDCCFDPSAVELLPKGRRVRSASGESSNDEPYLRATLALRGRTRAFRPGGASALWQLLVTGFAAGLRPCVGAIFVLTASIAAKVPSIGIAATFAMAAGVAITVTLVGLGALGANRLLARRPVTQLGRLRMTQRWIAASGALLIMLFGAAQVSLLFSGYMQPSLN